MIALESSMIALPGVQPTIPSGSLARLSSLSCAPKPGDGPLGFQAARACPGDELRDINAAICRFAIIDPTLRLLQQLSQLALRQSRLLTQRSQEGRQTPIGRRVLRFGRHPARS